MNKNFLFLFIGGLVSLIGDAVYMVALSWWVVQNTSSKILMGLVMTFTLLPTFLAVPFGGVLADKFNKKKILVNMDLGRGVLFIAMALLYKIGWLNVPMLIIFTCAAGIMAAFFNPSMLSIVPSITGKEFLSRAMGLIQSAMGISMIIGFALGGVFVSRFGFFWVFLINGLSFLFSAVMETLMAYRPGPQPEAQDGKEKRRVADDLKEGFAYLKNNKKIFSLVKWTMMNNFCLSPLYVILPFLIKDVLKADSTVLGFSQMAFLCGVAAGSLGFSQILSRGIQPRYYLSLMCGQVLFTMMLVLWILALYLFGATIRFPLFYGLIVIAGAGFAAVNVTLMTYFQLHVDANVLGRFHGFNSIAVNLATPLAYLLAGVLLEVVSPVCALSVFTLLLILVGIYFLSPNHMRDL